MSKSYVVSMTNVTIVKFLSSESDATSSTAYPLRPTDGKTAHQGGRYDCNVRTDAAVISTNIYEDRSGLMYRCCSRCVN